MATFLGPEKKERRILKKTPTLKPKRANRVKNDIITIAKMKVQSLICSKNRNRGKAAWASIKRNFAERAESLQCALTVGRCDISIFLYAFQSSSMKHKLQLRKTEVFRPDSFYKECTYRILPLIHSMKTRNSLAYA